MKKWIIAIAVLLVLLLGYVAAGPYLAIRGIHRSLQSRELGNLERYVDFPALRANIRAQVEDRLARAAGERAEGMLGGSLAAQVMGQLSATAVDAMVSPTGIAVLLEGRALARRIGGEPLPGVPQPGAPATDGDAPGNRSDPLADAETAYESPSRFTATTRGAEGRPVVFVFERKGITWRLTDIRLPN